MVEINEAERKKELNEDKRRGLWDNVKCYNIQIIGIPEDALAGGSLPLVPPGKPKSHRVSLTGALGMPVVYFQSEDQQPQEPARASISV